jgi:hypothetical protein
VPSLTPTWGLLRSQKQLDCHFLGDQRYFLESIPSCPSPSICQQFLCLSPCLSLLPASILVQVIFIFYLDNCSRGIIYSIINHFTMFSYSTLSQNPTFPLIIKFKFFSTACIWALPGQGPSQALQPHHRTSSTPVINRSLSFLCPALPSAWSVVLP